MEYREKLKFCEELFAKDYKITKDRAHKIIRDYDLEDDVFETYEEEIVEKEEQDDEEFKEYIKTYNDGWSDHVGV